MELTRKLRDDRIAVMRDVLKQLNSETNRLRVMRAGYYVFGDIERPVAKSDPLQPIVDLIQEHCFVCMKGATFLSFVRLFDKATGAVLSPNSLSSRFNVEHEPMMKVVRTLFDDEEMHEMEAEFERWHDANGFTDDMNARDAARAIAQNVIDNDGEYLPPEGAMIDLELITVADIFEWAAKHGLTIKPGGWWISDDRKCCCPGAVLALEATDEPSHLIEHRCSFTSILRFHGLPGEVWGLVARGFEGRSYGTDDEQSDAYLLGVGCRKRALEEVA